MVMQVITLSIDEELLRKARQFAAERETTLEALIIEHLAILADRAGRRLTAREQIYVDCQPSEEVKQALREDFAMERWRAR
jgi:hypothetical protein